MNKLWRLKDFMVKSKHRELFVACYIVQNVDLLFKKYLSDIKIQEIGERVELILSYSPKSKYDVWNLRKELKQEQNYTNMFIQNNMLCARFLVPSKFANLIICKMYTYEPLIANEKIFDYCETENPGHSY